MSRVSFLLSLALAFALVLGNPAHAFIPHEHGDHHNTGDTAVWQSLHASLRHEDKQALPVFAMLSIIAVIVVARREGMRSETSYDVHPLLDYLRRGIVPHRKFG